MTLFSELEILNMKMHRNLIEILFAEERSDCI